MSNWRILRIDVHRFPFLYKQGYGMASQISKVISRQLHSTAYAAQKSILEFSIKQCTGNRKILHNIVE